MSLKSPVFSALLLAPLAIGNLLAGCEEKTAPISVTPAPKPATPSATPATTPATPKADGHDHAHDTDHKDEHGHGGPVVELGEQPIGAFTAKASRDAGQIVAGKDAPIDVTLASTAVAASQPSAVRFWIGTEDAKGSVKAKAEHEDPKKIDVWHVHVEIPSPLPPTSKLWVEIEDNKGVKSIGSFDLKM